MTSPDAPTPDAVLRGAAKLHGYGYMDHLEREVCRCGRTRCMVADLLAALAAAEARAEAAEAAKHLAQKIGLDAANERDALRAQLDAMGEAEVERVVRPASDYQRTVYRSPWVPVSGDETARQEQP